MSAKITISGYVKRPQARESKGGKPYLQYQLSVKTGKKADGKASYSYFSCRDFRDSAELPEEDSYLQVNGGLSISTNEKDGKTYTNLDVFVDGSEVPPKRDFTPNTKAASPKPAWD